MAERIPLGFLLQVGPHCGLEVDTGLVCKADQDEEDVRQLVSQIVGLIAFFLKLWSPKVLAKIRDSSPTSSIKTARLVISEKYRTPTV